MKIKKLNSIKSTIERVLLTAYVFLVNMFINTYNVLAEDEGGDTLTNNPIVKGLENMFTDGLKAIMTLSTAAIPFVIAFFQFKKKFADDEMEGKQYDKKTKTVIITYVVIMSVSVIISIITKYFNLSQ